VVQPNAASGAKELNLIIRPATHEDYSAGCVLLEQLDALHRQNLPEVYQRNPTGETRSLDYWMRIIANDRAAVFIGEVSGNIVGLIHVMLQDTSAIPILVPRRFAFIDTLIVDQDHRHKGIAQALMQAAEVWAINGGAEYAELTVLEFNHEAIAFYDKLRYETVNRKMRKSLR
jgi:ribosomal protein S18 acetylase RimI-like enzyme